MHLPLLRRVDVLPTEKCCACRGGTFVQPSPPPLPPALPPAFPPPSLPLSSPSQPPSTPPTSVPTLVSVVVGEASTAAPLTNSDGGGASGAIIGVFAFLVALSLLAIAIHCYRKARQAAGLVGITPKSVIISHEGSSHASSSGYTVGRFGVRTHLPASGRRAANHQDGLDRSLSAVGTSSRHDSTHVRFAAEVRTRAPPWVARAPSMCPYRTRWARCPTCLAGYMSQPRLLSASNAPAASLFCAMLAVRRRPPRLRSDAAACASLRDH